MWADWAQMKYIKLHDGAPMLLLGRSGTGKTTCMVFRLWTEFSSYWASAVMATPRLPSPGGGFTHMHQLFTTSNPVLRAEVRRYFHALRRGFGKSMGPFRDNKAGGAKKEGKAERVGDQEEGEDEGEGMEEGEEEEEAHERVHSLLLGQLQETRFPLFMTKRELLVAIDGTLKEPFFPRLDDGTGVSHAPVH
jgi:hypothetical protein